jgi:hypothetical protein
VAKTEIRRVGFSTICGSFFATGSMMDTSNIVEVEEVVYENGMWRVG